MIKKIMNLTNSFSGCPERIGRLEYLVRTIINSVLMVFAAAALRALISIYNSSVMMEYILVVYILAVFFIIWAIIVSILFLMTMGVYISRLRDLNKNTWFFLISFVPYIAIIFHLYLLLAPGKSQPDRNEIEI